jgi:hypothetical protein
VGVQVLRGGEELEYDLKLDPLQTLVPVHKYDQLPSYYIWAGERIGACTSALTLAAADGGCFLAVLCCAAVAGQAVKQASFAC